jgi:aspartate racemase
MITTSRHDEEGPPMLTIGLLGGMSCESSAEYYRLLNEEVRRRLGGLHSADCLLYSLDFAPVAALQAEGRWDEAADVLRAGARRIEAGGADLLLICTNTMHKLADEVAAAVDIPLLHVGDGTAQAIQAAGLSRVGLLGTAFTMEQPFLRDRLEGHGLEVLIPDTDDRAEVHRVIYEELCRGVVRDESRDYYRSVMARLVDHGAQGIIAGCTEIELLVSAADCAVPLFPTTRLHALAAVDRALDAPG